MMEQTNKEVKALRTVACCKCEARIPKGNEIRRAKNGGDIFLWCRPCFKKFNVKKVKLLKRGN